MTVPDVAVSMPPKMLSAVVLPAPDAPRMTASSPRSTVKFAPSSALICDSPAPYVLTTLLNSMYAMGPPSYVVPRYYSTACCLNVV